MTARRTAPTAIEPKTYDLDAWLNGFTPATVRVRLFRRGDLMPRIDELEAEIAKLAGPEDAERSVADGAEINRLTGERDRILEEFESSAEWFEFQALSDLHTDAAMEKAKKAGYPIKLNAQNIPVDGEAMWHLRMFQMAETCTSHEWLTGEAFIALQRRIGDASLIHLARGWEQVMGLGNPDAPFSPPASPTPTTEAS